MTHSTLLAVAGTRPELLKLAPVIRQIRLTGGALSVRTCFSGQHVEILESVLGDVDVTPDIDLRSAPAKRSLTQNLAWLLEQMEHTLELAQPDGVIVQGDTNTVLAAALAAFHHQLPSFHVEAGLRTARRKLPFPEEINRRLVTRLASLHFAPTERARQNLLLEGVDPARVLVTGNTGIDALMLYAGQASEEAEAVLGRLRPHSRKLLVTLHRRENATLVRTVTSAIERVIAAHPDVEVLWVLHLNGIRSEVTAQLGNHPSVHLLEPQSYKSFVHLMKSAYFVLSDSGGVQEEAPVLGKPVLVLRRETERMEAVEAGSSWVVGCGNEAIEQACHRLLDDPALYQSMSQPRSPFGDGHASEQIVRALQEFFQPSTAASFFGSWPPAKRRELGILSIPVPPNPPPQGIPARRSRPSLRALKWPVA
jgi:UDP-N-acetylglucosamine 2-epimerase